jgi:hypothetical protein
MHGTQGMLEPAVDSSGIDGLNKAKLLDALQSLHLAGLNEMPLQLIYPNSTMNRVAKSAMHAYQKDGSMAALL